MQESQYMEFKPQWKDDLLKWISAFANAEGAALLVGYDGQAVGIQHAQKLLEDIPNKVRDVLGIVTDVNLQLHGALETLHIQVPAYPYPVSYKVEHHYRSGSTEQELKGAALDRFLQKTRLALGLRYPRHTLFPASWINALSGASASKLFTTTACPKRPCRRTPSYCWSACDSCSATG